jgi:hypothetical protein
VLTLVKWWSTWAITSKTSLTNPNDTFWSTIVNLGQNPTQNPWLLFDPPVSAGTFAAFSKFHLNTSKSLNVKVVCFVEGHNFHVEWHLKFWVEMCEKLKSMLRVTIHQSRVFCHVPLRVLQNLWSKTLVDLNKSCRGSLDLQLSYRSFGPLLLKNFEKSAVNQC